MSVKYQAYPEYKDSGVEWLGEIPREWELHSLKRCVGKVTNGIWGNEPNGKSDITVLRVADFDRQKASISDSKLTLRAIDLKDRASRLLEKGDLLIEKSGGGDKTLVGCVVLFDKTYLAVTSNFVAKMTPKNGFDSSFLRYCFAHLYSGRVNFPAIKQTTGIQNLDSEAYLCEYCAYPKHDSQTIIANFLDHETAEIDLLIEKQEKLIELLQEKRQAVISHAVTKGLNPDAPMKDSGVEWLGEVPAHWEVAPLKHNISTLNQGWSPQCDNAPAILGQYGVMKVGCVNNGFFNNNENKGLPANLEPRTEHTLKKNDLLISRANTSELVGSAAVVDRDYNHLLLCDKLYRLRFKTKLNPQFVSYYLETSMARSQFEVESGGASHSMQNISQSTVKDLPIATPSINEQKQILSYIKDKLSSFKTLSAKTTLTRQLLQERRTALISVAVTGKIDLRNWQAPTPTISEDN